MENPNIQFPDYIQKGKDAQPAYKLVKKMGMLFVGLLCFALILWGAQSNTTNANVTEEDYYSSTTITAQTAYNSATLSRISAEEALAQAEVAYDNAYFAEANSMKALAMAKYSDLLVAGYDVCSDRMLELGEKAGVEKPACDFQ